MTEDEQPRESRRHRSRRKRSARRKRRTLKILGWSLVGLIGLSLFVTGVIYLVLSMRGEGTGIPTAPVERPTYGAG